MYLSLCDAYIRTTYHTSFVTTAKHLTYLTKSLRDIISLSGIITSVIIIFVKNTSHHVDGNMRFTYHQSIITATEHLADASGRDNIHLRIGIGCRWACTIVAGTLTGFPYCLATLCHLLIAINRVTCLIAATIQFVDLNVRTSYLLDLNSDRTQNPTAKVVAAIDLIKYAVFYAQVHIVFHISIHGTAIYTTNARDTA